MSTVLTQEFGKGFSVTNIQQMRKFYLAYRKQQTLSVKSDSSLLPTEYPHFELGWSHYLTLIRIDDIAERQLKSIFNHIQHLNSSFNSCNRLIRI